MKILKQDFWEYYWEIYDTRRYGEQVYSVESLRTTRDLNPREIKISPFHSEDSGQRFLRTLGFVDLGVIRFSPEDMAQEISKNDHSYWWFHTWKLTK